MQVSDPINGSSGTGGIALPTLLFANEQVLAGHITSEKHGWFWSGPPRQRPVGNGKELPAKPSLAYHSSGCSRVRKRLKSISLQYGRHWSPGDVQSVLVRHAAPEIEQWLVAFT
jgi:hypothetical protein